MTALAIDADGATAGIVGQGWWARQEKSPEPKKDKRPAEQRESILWSQALLQAEQALATSTFEGRAWYQLDRGADSGAVLELASDRKLRITVRSAHDRSLIDDEHLRARLRASPRLGSYTLRLPKTAKREARTARLVLRAAPVTVCINNAKGRLRRTVSLFAVHVREWAKPKQGARLEWWLLTTVPTATFEEARLVVTHYTKRWRVEEFHRAWKSGVCNIERSQLRSDDSFKRWATISAAVAARAERLKTVSRAEPERAATDELSRDEIDAAILLSPGSGRRRGDVLTIAEAVLLVANLGGYTGKSSGGPPGVRVIQRGLDQIAPAARALAALRRSG